MSYRQDGLVIGKILTRWGGYRVDKKYGGKIGLFDLRKSEVRITKKPRRFASVF